MLRQQAWRGAGRNYPTASQRVDRRRLNEVVACAAQRVAAQLVQSDQQEVGHPIRIRGGHRLLLCYTDATCRSGKCKCVSACSTTCKPRRVSTRTWIFDTRRDASAPTWKFSAWGTRATRQKSRISAQISEGVFLRGPDSTRRISTATTRENSVTLQQNVQDTISC